MALCGSRVLLKWKRKEHQATRFTLVLLLQEGAGAGPGGRPTGVERVVGGSGGHAGAAGARALRAQAGRVQELGVLGRISRCVEGQLLLLQELDFLQLLLELLVLELLLLLHALGRETHADTSRETSRQERRASLWQEKQVLPQGGRPGRRHGGAESTQ